MTFASAAVREEPTVAQRRRTKLLSIVLRLGFCAAMAASLSGCLGYDGDIVHGYQLDPTLLNQVKIGS